MGVGQAPERTITLEAPAKVNLSLSVGSAVGIGAPKAGYHPVDSVMACVGLSDVVRLTPRNRDSSGEPVPSGWSVRWADDAPRCSPFDWPAEKDLAVRAVRILERHVGRQLPVGLEITKRIPVGSGLGGGSSDAAAAMVAVDRAFGLRLPTETLMAVGAEVGSDVPFFVRCARDGCRQARVSGFGERVDPLPWFAGSVGEGRGGVVLVLPPFGCATVDVYKEFDRAPGQAGRGFEADLAGPHSNQLAEPAMRVEPRLRALFGLVAAKAGARATWITGSGSTICVQYPGQDATTPVEVVRSAVRAGVGRSEGMEWLLDVVCVPVRYL